MTDQMITNLETRINELIQKFVQEQIEAEQQDPLTYIPDLDKLAAFRLLVHAEFEEFIETKAKNALREKIQKIKSNDFKTREHPEIFAISNILSFQLPTEHPFDKAKFISSIESLIRAAEKIISDNNGIKESSFQKLSIFCGKMIDEIDEVLATSLSSYGKSRGDVAHKSARRVTTLLAPSIEAKSATDIVEGLKGFFKNAPASVLPEQQSTQ
jgi:hypothetical protein